MASIRRWAPRFVWILFAAVATYHLTTLLRTAVDIPFGDEWEMLRPGVLRTTSFSGWVHWLFAQHNEHRIVLTQLLRFGFLRVADLNGPAQIAFNFALFLILLLAVYRLLARHAQAPIALVLVLGLTLSPINWENHSWAFQSQFHLFLLFLVLAIHALFGAENVSRRRVLLGALSLALAMLSFSAGVVSALAVAVVHLVERLRTRSWTRHETAFAAVIFGGAAAYLGTFTPVAGHPGYVLPYRFAYWQYWFNFVANGFGFTDAQAAWGIVACGFLGLGAGPVMRMGRRRELAPLALLLALLAVASVISVGRAGFGVTQAKSSRYTELAFLLMPVGFTLLKQSSRAGSGRAGFWRGSLAAFGIFCLVGYADNFNFRVYPALRASRQAGLACVRDYYRDGGAGFCPSLYPSPIADRLDAARDVGLSFVRSALAFDAGPRTAKSAP